MSMPDGVVTVRTGGNRFRTYAVHFKGGEAIEVDVEARRFNTRPFWRLVWRAGDKPMSIIAACAVRAALAKTEGARNE